jgi:hypothetical protein
MLSGNPATGSNHHHAPDNQSKVPLFSQISNDT